MIEVRTVAPKIGAEITGVDVRAMDAATWHVFERAFVDQYLASGNQQWSTPVVIGMVAAASLIAAVTLAPVIASYAAYYLFPRSPAVNYGTLLPTAPIEGIAGTRPDGSPFRLEDLRGRWVLLALGRADCGAPCERKLYATRQARTMQGRYVT